MELQPISKADQALTFGPFRLLSDQRILLQAGTPVRLGSRALDLLIELVERRGELISKKDLIAQVWPDTFVEEVNLRVHLAALRKALGDGRAGNRYIANVPGRGYRFVAPVSVADGPQPAPVRPSRTESQLKLPAPLSRMVGRDDVVAVLVDQVPRLRFITLVGPGGIGKTTVAIAAADRLMPSYKDNGWFIDLARISDPRVVTTTVASVLGIPTSGGDPVPSIVAFLRHKQCLIVLDSCEHVIEPVAALAEALFKGAAGVNTLATSREPLRAEGERIHRLPALGTPPVSARLTAAEALSFPSVQLFVERAASRLDGFALGDHDAPVVADICRKLDGIALAIELAACRIDAFGVRGLAEHLDDRFRLLTQGRRTALLRHQTLKATLDWSYDLLAESERAILRRLSTFAGGFTLESATAMATDTAITPSDVVEGIANLVAKSLIAADVHDAVVQYRLLDTTRAYCLEKLRGSGELAALTRRHAEHLRKVFEAAESEWQTQPTTDWLAIYSRRLDDLRIALDWAFSETGDAAIGVALTVAAVPLWTHLSLNQECRRRAERALASFKPADDGDVREMKLSAALGAALLYTGHSEPEMNSAWSRSLTIAEKNNDMDYQTRALWGLWVDSITRGEFRPALSFAQRFCRIAANATDHVDPLVGERMTGYALYFLGEQTRARQHIEHMLDRYVAPVHRSHIIRFQFDQRVLARATLAEILWLQGFPDQATHMVEGNIDLARTINHAISLSYALAQSACPIALLTGNVAAAEQSVAALLDLSSTHPLTQWNAWGRCFNGVLLIGRGDTASGLNMLDEALSELPRHAFHMRYTALLGELADGLGRAGEIARSLATIDEALARSDQHEERWCVAELLRIKGETVLRAGGPDAALVAEEHFRLALDWARRQGALAWELRAATSLARLQHDHGRSAEALSLLGPVYDRFREGHGTADLKTAKSVLESLDMPPAAA